MKKVGLLLIVAFLATSQAWASPRFPHLSWSRPDASTTMTVTWMTDSMDEPTMVEYGIAAPGQFEAKGEVFKGNDALGAIHVVELTDLDPATTYKYRAGGTGNWSDTYEFTTAPDDPCEPFRFAAFGDNRPDTDWIPQFHWNPILAETAEAGPAFVLHTGDLVMDGGETVQWNTFFETSEPYTGYLPFMATIGNHDDGPGQGDGANFNQVFSFPRNQVTDTEDFYYFTYGNSVIVSLSTAGFSDGDPPYSMQAEWLDQVLSDNPKMWKFVFFHHPPYTSHLKMDLIFTEIEFPHPPNEQQQNDALVPVFDKHGVDIVFNGHNHFYERLGPMTGSGDPTQGQPVSSFLDGTVYAITGGAGAMVYADFNLFGLELNPIDWVCGSAAGSETCSGDHHYVTVDIDNNHLRFEVWATAEQTLGNAEANVHLIDSFDIVKDPIENCDETPPIDLVVVETGLPEQDIEIVSQPEPDFEVLTQPEPAPDANGQPVQEVAGELAGSSDQNSSSTQDGRECPDCDPNPVVEAAEAPTDTSDCGCRMDGPLHPASGTMWLVLLLAAFIVAFLRRSVDVGGA